ncbi:MAG: hypothetical protein F6K11_35350, partial [Leptolyngbya sp. SIO3F4]|nr:hypothetical protein [Leptolyngbya sp. SIO3F4]
MLLRSLNKVWYSRPLNWLALLSVVAITNPSPAKALTFNFSHGADAPQEVHDAITAAGNLWSSHLSDDVELNIHIDFGELPEGILGGARPNMVRVKYEDVLKGMFLDKTSTADQIAFNNLQINEKDRKALEEYSLGRLDVSKLKFSKESEFSLLMTQSTLQDPKNNDGSKSKEVYLDNNGNENNRHIWMTRANAKALGLVDRYSQEFDATIRFNNSALWDFYRSDGISSDALDFLTVAQHEIGHALGVVSGSDIAGLLQQNKDKAVSEKD